MIFHHQIRVEFAHCDPAGIMFYPRYVEMTNSVSETFFREAVGYAYPAMMAQLEGAPTAALNATYLAPVRHGDLVDWQLSITKLGRSSIVLHQAAYVGGKLHFKADLTLVFVHSEKGPQPWPEAMRQAFAPYIQG